jgi:hypothetical protein
MNEGGGDKIYDLSGNSITLALTNIGWTPGKTGFSILINSTSDTVIANQPVASQTEGTIVFIIKKISSYGSDTALCQVDTTALDSSHVLSLRCVGGGSIRFYPNLTQDSDKYWSFGNHSTTLPAYETVSLVVVWKQNRLLQGYRNGMLYGVQTGTTAWTASSWSANEIFSMNKPSGTVNACIELAYIFNRALSASEIAWLYREPFAMFDRPSIGLLYVPPAGGQTILDYERGVRGVNRGVMVGVS